MRKPAAFDLSEVRYEPEDIYPKAAEGEEEAGSGALVPAPVRRRSHRWLAALASAAGGLIVLGLVLAVDNLVRDLFARYDWLGWVGMALAAIVVVAIIVLAAREIVALLHLRRITKIHRRATDAAASDDRDEAVAVIGELRAFYKGRPETARGRAALSAHGREIIDGRDLIGLAETELLLPFDESARRMVLSSAKRVALVTAISPRAVVDLVFVGGEILRLIRRLATLYGGRPGTIGFFRLAKATIAHLAVTGGMAAGDSIVQQILGHGVAARLSARLGEGVVNGLLTARVGIAAIEVTRPLPFITGSPPRIGDVMAALRPLAGEKE